ncbi:MAG: hypothetical protein RI947_1342 [Candidatus Parcubacteria bacterium]|jgi:hypothetical protein
MKPVVTFALCVVIAAVAFFAGMKYQQTRVPQMMRFQGRGGQAGGTMMFGRNSGSGRPVS